MTLWRRKRQELQEEIDAHLRMAEDDRIAHGENPSHAAQSARRELGNGALIHETTRDQWGWRWLETLLLDIRYGLRTLRKSPGFTIVAVLTLALGIGANAAIFSVVDAVLLRPLPFHNPDRLVQLWETEGSPGNFPLMGEDFLDWRAQNSTFDDMSVYSYEEDFNASADGETERATIVETQANFFSLLGARPILGRLFAQGEDQAGQNHVAILSYGFWQQNFGGQADAIGKSLELNGAKYSVVGVLPQWYRMPATADAWIPLDVSVKGLGGRGGHHLKAIGRLKGGVSVGQASANLRAIAARIEKQFPNSNSKVSAVVVPLKEQLVGGFRSELWLMFAAVGFVLLIACVNVANLLLVRSAGRKREVAVRSALGASRSRLVRQLITESVLLSLCGAVAGIGLAWICVRAVAAAKTFPIPQPNPVEPNPVVLLLAIIVSIGIGLLFGILPAFQISQLKLSNDLKVAGRKGFETSPQNRWLRDALVAAEVALSLVLLAAAGLLLRTFADLRRVDIGAKAQNVLTGMVQLPPERYATPESKKAFLDQFLTSLRNMPGVRGAAVSDVLPLNPGTSGYFQISGSSDESLKTQLVETSSVTSDYFRVLGIPVIRGRAFNQTDIESTENAVNDLEKRAAKNQSLVSQAHIAISVVINKAMADRFWPNQDALGKTFGSSPLIYQVVGVAGNTHQFGLRKTPLPELYYPLPITLEFGQEPLPFSISVLTVGPPENLTRELAAAVHSQDKSLALFNVRTISQIVSDSMTDTSYQTFLLGALAALALVLAAVGTYGVMSYLVSQRTNEIGIRMALGAGRSQVLWMVLRKGLAMAAVGMLAGIAGTLALTKVLQEFLYGVKPGDPLTLAAVCFVMLLVALAACAIPAVRAMRVDPIVALRYE